LAARKRLGYDDGPREIDRNLPPAITELAIT